MKTQESAVTTPVSIMEEQTGTGTVAWPSFSHEIGLTEARELVNRYRRANPAQRHAVAVTRVPLDAMLAQKGCAGIRIYFALNPDGTPTVVVVGADEDGNDQDEGFIAEYAIPCPPFCPLNSALDG